MTKRFVPCISPALPWVLPIVALLLGRPIFAADSASTNTPLSVAASEPKQPRRTIAFREVIQSTTSHRILSVDTNNPDQRELLEKIDAAARNTIRSVSADGISTARPNEAGNHIEPIVRAALREVGLDARVPVNSNGDAQSTGYPDIEIAGPMPCYLELKTYSAATANTTQRTFYYSPSPHPKITRDALHFLLAFELEKQTRDGQSVFVPVHWKLLTLENLTVELKMEFNQSNRGLYGSEAGRAPLSEGGVD